MHAKLDALKMGDNEFGVLNGSIYAQNNSEVTLSSTSRLISSVSVDSSNFYVPSHPSLGNVPVEDSSAQSISMDEDCQNVSYPTVLLGDKKEEHFGDQKINMTISTIATGKFRPRASKDHIRSMLLLQEKIACASRPSTHSIGDLSGEDISLVDYQPQELSLGNYLQHGDRSRRRPRSLSPTSRDAVTRKRLKVLTSQRIATRYCPASLGGPSHELGLVDESSTADVSFASPVNTSSSTVPVPSVTRVASNINRKRRRTAAGLDKRVALRCIECSMHLKGAYTFGDYVQCERCGGSGMAVIRKWSPTSPVEHSF